MTWTELLLRDSSIALAVMGIGVLVIMLRKHLLRDYPLLAALVAVQSLDVIKSVGILFYRRELGLEVHTAFKIYFYTHWIAFFCCSVLELFIIYSVFSLAMKPLQGLHEIGKIIFRWVAAVSIMVSLAIAVGPHVLNGAFDPYVVIPAIASQIQQGTSVLTLCLLLFVCFSTKPLGLTYRSRTFGVVLGLGIMATTTLVQSAWTAIAPARSLYSPIALFGTIGLFFGVTVWGSYFALPEPERKLILLPTTSPFFFWNRISEALGDAPGHVAIAGFRPDMLAAAEMQMLTAPTIEREEEPAHTMQGITVHNMPMLQSVASL